MRIAVRRISILLLVWFLAGCSLSPVLIIDPLLHGLADEVQYRDVEAAVLDGEYPWEQELSESISLHKTRHIILSPLLSRAGTSAAIDNPEIHFYLLGLHAADLPDPHPENLRLVSVSRDEAIQELGALLQGYVEAQMPGESLDREGMDPDPFLTVLLYTGDDSRKIEAELLEEYIDDFPAGFVRIRRFETLPDQQTIENELDRTVGYDPHVLVVLLSQRSAEAVRIAVENEALVISEHLGSIDSAPREVVGSIDIDLPDVVAEILRSISSNSWDSPPQADLQIRENFRFPVMN